MNKDIKTAMYDIEDQQMIAEGIADLIDALFDSCAYGQNVFKRENALWLLFRLSVEHSKKLKDIQMRLRQAAEGTA